MFIKSLVFSLLSTNTMAASLPDPTQRHGCSAPSPSKEQKAILKQMAWGEAMAESSLSSASDFADIIIPTYMHIVTKSNSTSDGYLTKDIMTKQINILNNDYKGTGFQFSLKDVIYTINSNWASNYDEMVMKRKLRRGDYKTLNMYWLGSMNDRSGYCYYPVRVSQGSEDFYRDGCSLGSWVAPIGNGRFNRGQLATHEVGHWSNLVHTFGESSPWTCSGDGDFVDDTPAQNGPSDKCPQGRDSCPSPGVDPIHNYMDYTDDACKTEFTRGQITRMQNSYNMFRA